MMRSPEDDLWWDFLVTEKSLLPETWTMSLRPRLENKCSLCLQKEKNLGNTSINISKHIKDKKAIVELSACSSEGEIMSG